jgi:multidrug efflux pump subunit AcrA (membrane-fusion protein)
MPEIVDIRQMPRDKLLAVFKTQEMVKLFESLLRGVGTALPGNIAEVLAAAQAAQLAANEAQFDAATAQSTADGAQADATQGILDAAAALAAAIAAQATADTALSRTRAYAPRFLLMGA